VWFSADYLNYQQSTYIWFYVKESKQLSGNSFSTMFPLASVWSEASSAAIANVYFVSFNNDRYLTLTV
jgi:hypothetical protein